MEFKASEYEFTRNEFIVIRLEQYTAHRPCKKASEAVILGEVLSVTSQYAYIVVTQVLRGSCSERLLKLSRCAKYERAYILQEN